MKPNASLRIRKKSIPKITLRAGSVDLIEARSLPMASEHVTRAYDEELRRLNNTVAEMGGLAESQLGTAIEAVMRRDSEVAAHVVEGDVKVDQLEREIDNLAIRLLALRQPVARDLREIFSALKIGSDLERIGDYAVNVAKRSIALSQTPAVRPVYALPRMAQLAQTQIKDVLDSYVQRDADKAYAVWKRDTELDEMYSSLFRELLTYMMEDPRSIGSCTHLLFMAKNIERIGDHGTNIAENLYYLVNGTPLEEARPKGDVSSLEVMTPDRAP
jgi:phosphate transport system protein